MTNYDLLFFCTMCRNKTQEEIAKIKCSIPYSIKEFRKGEHIAYQGSQVSHLKMLIKGRVKTEIVANSGWTLPMEEIEAPFPLAAAFLFADDNRFPIDVIATEDCEILFISKESVERQISRCSGFLRGFMAFNANRMQYISERLKIFAQKGIKAKIAYYILSKENNGIFELGRSVALLAGYFGVERPSLSRAISEMVRDGIITFDSGKGRIVDSKAIINLLS